MTIKYSAGCGTWENSKMTDIQKAYAAIAILGLRGTLNITQEN